LAIIGSVFETFKGSNNLVLVTEIIEYYVVARGGVEPPTHGFTFCVANFSQLLTKEYYLC